MIRRLYLRGTVPSYDESLYTSLACMINEEPVHPRDLGQ